MAVRVIASESDARSGAFAEAWGFFERQRSWESRLDVNRVVGEPFAAHTTRVVADGILIRTLSELLAEAYSRPLSTPRERGRGKGLARSMPGDATRALLAAIHALDTDASADLPGLDPPTPVAYAIWAADVIDAPGALPDATFLAIDLTGTVGRAGTPGSPVGMAVLARTRGVPGSLFVTRVLGG